MRLVLLAHAPVRGGSTELLFQARDYFQREHEVTVVFGGRVEPMDARAEGAVFFSPQSGSWREQLCEYVALVEGLRPDLVYGIAGERELDLFRFLRCVRVRHVSSLEQHGFADIPHWLVRYRDYFEACSANSPDALDEVQRLTQRPTYLLPYRLPANVGDKPVQLPEQIDPMRPIEVAFISRLERLQKRAHWLPEIVRASARLGAQLNWHIYGDGPEETRLRQRLADAKNVTFHGWTERARLYRELPHCDIAFSCSRWEGLPIALVEAMRCGLACVAPDIPAGIRWTFSHGGGWLYEGTSPAQAARALVEATRNRAQLLEKRREALRLSSELFPNSLADDYYPQLEKAFRELVYNGQTLEIQSAPKFSAVPWSGYARRFQYALETAVHSPARLLCGLAKPKRLP